MADFIAHYGYLAVFAGTLLEGETVLALAAYSAYRGQLSLPLVIAVAFFGATLGDQVFFFIGRRFGKKLLVRSKRLQKEAERVDRLLLEYHGVLIIGVRFAYGLRIAGPILIGMSNLPSSRFLFFNAIGAAIWAPLIAGVGYFFGQTLDWLFVDAQKYEEIGLAVIVGLFVVIAIVGHFKRRDRS